MLMLMTTSMTMLMTTSMTMLMKKMMQGVVGAGWAEAKAKALSLLNGLNPHVHSTNAFSIIHTSFQHDTT